MKRPISYLWAIPALLLFPVLQLLIFYLRFHNMPAEMFKQSLVFAPIGLISVAVLIYFLRKSDVKPLKKGSIIGFLVALPYSLFSSMFAGLINTSFIFIGIYGSIPLIIGTALGFVISKRFVKKISPPSS